MTRLRAAQLGALLAFLGVALGAFGTHSLTGVLTPERLGTYQTGIRYQMYHALGLLAVGALPLRTYRPALLLFTGSVIFSGSLYVLALSGVSWFGAVAPVGGLLQLAGWAWLFFALRK